MATPRITQLTTADGPQSSLSVSAEQGDADVAYALMGADEDTPPTPNEINDCIAYFVGGVSNVTPKVVDAGTASAGLVARVLPKVHPLRPELSAESIHDLRGAGQELVDAPADAALIDGLTPATETYPNYPQWHFRVRYTKRPYFLLPDDRLPIKTDLVYYKPDGSSGIPIKYVEEYYRYTTTTRTPTLETVNADSGQVTLRTQSGVNPPNGVQFTGKPFMSLDNELVEVMWYQVPFRYFGTYDGHRPYLGRFTNTVNQHPFQGEPAGSLLYLGATPSLPYIGVSPTRKAAAKALTVAGGQGLLCNVKLKFLLTTRVGTDVPNSGHALLTNKNRIAAGHNLLPNFPDRTFRYAVGGTSTDADADRRPLFESFPFQLLFTDPMLAQQGGAI